MRLITEVCLHWMGHYIHSSNSSRTQWRTSVNTMDFQTRVFTDAYRQAKMRLICGPFNARALPKSLLDRTKEVSCGVEACERIMRTKQGSERGQEQARQGAWKTPHVRSSEKPIFRLGEGWLTSCLCHLFSVYCVSSALAGPDWLVDWPVHWSAWTGGQVCGVFFFWSFYPVSVTVSEKMLMLFYKCQTWFIKCESFEGLCMLWRCGALFQFVKLVKVRKRKRSHVANLVKWALRD